MADRALNLDDFLSRFQLLRPQPSRHALNQRQRYNYRWHCPLS